MRYLAILALVLAGCGSSLPTLPAPLAVTTPTATSGQVASKVANCVAQSGSMFSADAWHDTIRPFLSFEMTAMP